MLKYDSPKESTIENSCVNTTSKSDFCGKLIKGTWVFSSLKIQFQIFQILVLPKEVGGVGEGVGRNGQGKQEGNVNTSLTFTQKHLLNT